MKKIIVTGGLGYIGSHTVVELIQNNYFPIIIDNLYNTELFILDRIEQISNHKPDFYKLDILDTNNLIKIINKYDKIDGIIHFAAYKAVNESIQNPLKYYKNNVSGIISILEAMQLTAIENIVFSSSCTVYGQPDQLPVTENSPLQKAWSPYGETKQMSEDILRNYINSTKNSKAIALRYFNPIGAHLSAIIGEISKEKPSNLMPFISETAAGLRDELVIFGNDYSTHDGTAIRDYIHVSDLAEAHIKAIEYLFEQKDKFYDVFNVGTGNGYSVLDVLKSSQKAVQQPIKFRFEERRQGDIEQIWASCHKSNNILKWYPKYTLDQMTKSAIDWQFAYKKNN